jgi:acetylornithine/succinyldiaminopimelate/putrescine aminotransferase
MENVSNMSPELKAVLRIINEQTAMFQALVFVLGERGVIEPQAVRLKQQEYLADPHRALLIYDSFRQYLEELKK